MNAMATHVTSTSVIAVDSDVIAASQGDREAFGRLVESTKNMVCSIALAIVGDVEASQDIAQDVFLVAWRGLTKLRSPQSFLPWLRQTTRNRSRTWLRDNTRRRRVSEPAGDDLLSQAVDPRPDPAADIDAKERQLLLSAALSSLPVESREIVLLFYREGQSTEQVADLLEMNVDAVKQRLSRARRTLRKDVERRLADALVESMPTGAFTAAVMTGLSVAAPSASAATVIGAAAQGGQGVLAKALGLVLGPVLGAIGGAVGVIMGLRQHVREARDAEQLRRLLRFRAIGVGLVLAACVGLGGGVYLRNTAVVFLTYGLFNAALWMLYLVWLPQILGPSPDGVRRRRRRRWLLGLIGGGLSGLGGLLGGLFASGLLP